MLVGAGLHPSFHRETTEDSEGGYVLVLGVPHGETEQAHQSLQEYWDTEEQDEFKMLDEWKSLREEA